ncbi:sterile alpha motif domain-containing protein 9-like [Hydra vulgaris]|uniref:Sterile alpha motif domain-containing protein 9-like n=1 Tax=Hydra vulgaris TaxID=6087 RepID=A0ABM4C457_HYDVU
MLKNLLCKGEYKLPDDKCKYFLIINSYCTDECCKMSDFSDFNWVKHVNWKAIFDFNPDSACNGILSVLQDPNSVLIPPYRIAVDEFKKNLQNESTINMFLRSCQYETKPLHITCVENSVSNQHNFHLWRGKHFSEIKRLFDLLTSSEYIDSPSDMIFIICPCSNLNQKEFEYFLKNICVKPNILNEFVFLAQSNNHLEFVKNAILQEFDFDSNKCKFFREKSVTLKWSDVSAFVKQCKSVQTSKRYLITSRQKTPVIVKNEISEMFQRYGATILAANECDELFSETSENLTSLFSERMKTFMQGKEATWSLFFISDNIGKLPFKEALPSALIERDIVDEIKNKIDQLVTCKHICISLIGVGHLPGTGATTALMHVLWQYRSNFRCLLIDGHRLDANGIEEIVNHILSFRAFGESDDVINRLNKSQTCLPLLILLDNTTTEIAEVLQSKIQNEIYYRRILFETTVGIILYIQNRKLDVRNSKNLNEKFTVTEKVKFEYKLNQYEKLIEKKGLFPEDMLGFLTFMNSDVSSYYNNYVINIVDKIIDHLDNAYPTESKLLLYLAVFKCYIEDGNIPLSHAYKVLGIEWRIKDHDIKNFTCEYFQMLVKQSEEKKPGLGIYFILKITHLPLAKIILKQN